MVVWPYQMTKKWQYFSKVIWFDSSVEPGIQVVKHSIPGRVAVRKVHLRKLGSEPAHDQSSLVFSDAGTDVYELPAPKPLVWAVNDAVWGQTAGQVNEALEHWTKPVVEAPQRELSGSSTPTTISDLRSADTEIEFKADGPGTSIVVVNVTFDRGWSARADGEKVPVYRADGMMTALLLKGGRHRVALSYSPVGYKMGRVISGLGWLALAWNLGAGFRARAFRRQ
jgi:hypothetical protein